MGDVELLPLAHGDGNSFFPGWCSYPSRFGDSPEVEVLCGGVNSKIPEAAGIWRQGNLLHFGFDPHPGQLNAAGRALLENSIHYIARFRSDRPIAYTPSVFVTQRSIPRRETILGWFTDEQFQDSSILRYLGPEEAALFETSGRAAYRERFAAKSGYMGLDELDRLVLDPDLVTLGLRNDDPGLLRAAVDALGSEDRAGAARRVLARYVHGGPGEGAGHAGWAPWYEQHADHLFFLETGRYLWYVDTLSLRRGVPSHELRGPRRADAAP